MNNNYTHCITDEDQETGQVFCITHQTFVCAIGKHSFTPSNDHETVCVPCKMYQQPTGGEYASN